MDKSVWTPIVPGVGSDFMAMCLALVIPEHFWGDSNTEASQATEVLSDSTDPTIKSVVSWLRTSTVFLKQQPHLVVLLLGYLWRSLGISVMRLLITYVPKRFQMSFSQVRTFILISIHQRFYFLDWVLIDIFGLPISFPWIAQLILQSY